MNAININRGRNDQRLVIAVQNEDGILVPVQDFKDFWFNNKSPEILRRLYGNELVDILLYDHGMIRYKNNELSLSTIFRVNPRNTIMNILGKIGESVVVQRCKKDEALNLKLLRIASEKQVQKNTALEYFAIGTGFQSTKEKHPFIYNPDDTQRDIIWINKDGQHFQRKESTAVGGVDAGLQIKVSSNGMKYVYKDILEGKYEVPVIYFDMGNDFSKVYNRVVEELLKRNDVLSQERLKYLSKRFLSGRDIDLECYDELTYYRHLIAALINGEIKIEDLIQCGNDYKPLGASIMGSCIKNIGGDVSRISFD